MTDQLNNGLRYNGEGYDLLAAEPGLFSPWEHDIEPEVVCTSNWAGYVAIFDIRNQRLYLDNLSVGHTPRRGPPRLQDPDDPLSFLCAGSPPLPLLNGVAAKNAGSSYWEYTDINLALDYTGRLTLSHSTDTHERGYLQLHFQQGQLIRTTVIPKPDSLYESAH
ncbi:hypothetical protein [Microbulbifer aggregans]|uniref:hypothetical protein n=1 Tax=Microbulbifer aggregans TaxID=1769779 RepID=UPI001CFD04B2|nr:hypothetical protein [Microbulbifer aggregans]